MVKHSPAVAKICLIHGPPGTGKSKTIVGLLYRLLTEVGRRGGAVLRSREPACEGALACLFPHVWGSFCFAWSFIRGGCSEGQEGSKEKGPEMPFWVTLC